MIPSLKKLRKKIKKENIQIEKKPYFSLVEEYLKLQKKFHNKTFFEIFLLVMDMILYPLYIFYQVIQKDFSPFYIMSLSKCYFLWIEYFRFYELKNDINSWITVVKKLDGPWISTNDPEYHLYVYADSMERILLSRFTKKLTKRT